MKIDEEKLEELIRRSIQGEEEAQEALVQAVQNKVYYHCKKMLKKEEDAQDATQDVLIVMLSSLSKLREPAAFWGWVNGITANRCRHLLSAPHKEWQIPEDEEGVSLLDKAPNLDETLVPEQALETVSSTGGLSQPSITVSEPDGEGYVTYTIRYSNTAQVLMGNAGNASLAFTIVTQEYSLYDWYTGQLYFPDQRSDGGGQVQAKGEAQVEHEGKTFSISYEKVWQSGMDYGDWQESSRPGLNREITIDAWQDVTYTVRVPQDYDGVLLGVNIVDPPDLNRTIQIPWDLAVDDPAHYEFVRISDHAS